MDPQLHDKGYKRLFSDPYFLRELLTTFVKEPWVDDVELEGLELLPTEFVDERLRRSAADLLFRVRFRGQEAYLVILLEFQSTPDRFMALRVLAYQCQVWLSLADLSSELRDLPPVFPLVLYSGERRWHAPQELAELIAGGGAALAAYVPHFRYHLVDEHAYGRETLLAVENLVSGLFLLEQTAHQDVAMYRQAVSRWLKETWATHRAAAHRFMKWVLVRFDPDNRRAEEIWATDIESPEEFDKMLDQTLQHIRDEGRKEGRIEERRELAIKLLTRGLGVVEVAELTGLPEDEVRALGH
jgi:predicted transposase YdaD